MNNLRFEDTFFTRPKTQHQTLQTISECQNQTKPKNPENLETDASKLKLTAGYGGLYVISGNEKINYFNKAQERRLVYYGLNGEMPLLLARNLESARELKFRISQINQESALIGQETGIEITFIKPFIIIQNPENGKFDLKATIEINGKERVREVLQNGQIQSDQLSPFEINLWQGFQKAMRFFGDKLELPDQIKKQAGLNVYFNDKSEYVDLVQTSSQANLALDLPLHTQTKIISIEELTNCQTFGQLQQICQNQNPELIIKSSQDAGGEGISLVNFSNFQTKKVALLEELKAKNREPDPNYKLLVQSVIQPPEISHLPARIGINCVIEKNGDVKINAIAGQTYENSAKTEYLGSSWNGDLEAQILNKIGLDKIQNLVVLMAKMGYIGPIGFDAMLNQNGEYEFIYDCNPRLSAIMSIMSVREFLQKQDIQIQNLSNLGYRGRYKISQDNIQNLAKEKVLLKINTDTKDAKGVLLIPNLAGGIDSYDIILVNLNDSEIQTHLKKLSEFGQKDAKGQHLSELPIDQETNTLIFY